MVNKVNIKIKLLMKGVKSKRLVLCLHVDEIVPNLQVHLFLKIGGTENPVAIWMSQYQCMSAHHQCMF